jgi:hypothetical protein
MMKHKVNGTYRRVYEVSLLIDGIFSDPEIDTFQNGEDACLFPWGCSTFELLDLYKSTLGSED